MQSALLRLRPLFLIVIVNYNYFVNGGNQYWQIQANWDNSWKAGNWSYLDTTPVERARTAIISSVLIPMNSSPNASILDVGCGEGAISDFLSPQQKARYVGIDLSQEAIRLAQVKRGYPMTFVQVAASKYEPAQPFDVIIFSEVLDYVSMLRRFIARYIGFLRPGGIIIIALFKKTVQHKLDAIFGYARSTLDSVDEVDVSGWTKKWQGAPREEVSSHIEVFRLKQSSSS